MTFFVLSLTWGVFVLSDRELCRRGVAMGWAVGRPLDWDSLRITLSNKFLVPNE